MAVRKKKATEVSLIGPIIDAQTLKEENEGRRASRSFHASSIGDCGRKMWYGLKAFPQDPVVDHSSWKRDAAAGNAIHDQYQSMLIRAGVVLSADEALAAAGWKREDYGDDVILPKYAMELPLPPNPYRIGGRIDAIVKVEGDHWIMDIKTVKEKDFTAMTPGNFRFKKYMAQLNIYMGFSGIHNALIWLICRNDSKMREFQVFYDEDWFKATLERISRLKVMVDEFILPPPEPDFFGCGFCPFTTYCITNEKEL
jgi:CRISPR/Cas system-associated exonuclease Cas4 (RecB family)